MMGLPGETPAAIRQTSDFALSLNLDDMNMSKFTPFFGAPVWSTVMQTGTFDHDWRKMNCLNFVYVPAGVDSRRTLEALYNRHVKRFYSSRAWRRKFRRRLWENRHSLLRLVRHLPTFWAARRHFEPGGAPQNERSTHACNGS
jgi:magnesium-protoporphyrin IX monomethyl ester (oxidative) cyclase